MAKKTMEKNSLLKFFEIFKDNFFQIVMLGSILSFIAVVLTMASFGLSALLVHLFGQKAIFNYLTFCPFILIFPFVTAVLKIFRNYVREVPVLLWPDLKQAFTQNFGQSLILGVLSYLSIVLVFISYNYYSIATVQSPESTFAQLGVGVCTVFALMIVYITSYSMMMIVTLDLKLNKIITFLSICALIAVWMLILRSNGAYSGVCAALIGILTFFLCMQFKLPVSFFKRFGKYSLQLYLFNGYLLVISRTIIVSVLGMTNPFIIIAFNMLIDFFFSYMVIKYICEKIKPVKFLMGMV